MACTNLFKKGVPQKILQWLIEKELYLEDETI